MFFQPLDFNPQMDADERRFFRKMIRVRMIIQQLIAQRPPQAEAGLPQAGRQPMT